MNISWSGLFMFLQLKYTHYILFLCNPYVNSSEQALILVKTGTFIPIHSMAAGVMPGWLFPRKIVAKIYSSRECRVQNSGIWGMTSVIVILVEKYIVKRPGGEKKHVFSSNYQLPIPFQRYVD